MLEVFLNFADVILSSAFFGTLQVKEISKAMYQLQPLTDAASRTSEMPW